MQIAYDFKKYIVLKLNELTKFFRVKEDEVSTESLVMMADTIYKNLNQDQFVYALNEIMKNWKPEYGVKFPYPADFINISKGTSEERASLAWEAVLKAISKHGAYASIDFGDQTIHRVIKLFGGWPEVCKCETEKLHFFERDFKNSYTANLSNEFISFGDESDYLPGINETSNSNKGFRSDPIVKIQIQATPVYKLGSDSKKIKMNQLLKNMEVAK